MTVNSPYASPKATISRLAEWDLNTKKSLGQHFLIDDGVVGRILRIAELNEGEQVLEIGPGIGTLTEAMLLKGASVLAIEKDPRLVALLEETKQRYPKQFDYINADALEVIKATRPCHLEHSTAQPKDIVERLHNNQQMLSKKPTETPPYLPAKLIANLPYAVAATIVLDYFQYERNLQSATIMVQKEVADRMNARPGTKNYGAYSVKLQLIAEPKDSFKVAPSCFLPQPRVDSAVIRLDRRSDQALESDALKATFEVVEAAFAKRRKTIRNSMRTQFSERGIDPNIVDQLLKTAEISPDIRGEVLSPEKYKELGQIYMHILHKINI